MKPIKASFRKEIPNSRGKDTESGPDIAACVLLKSVSISSKS